jgi:hypothetical protein
MNLIWCLFSIRTVAYQTKHNVLNAHVVVASDEKAAVEEPVESSHDENSSDGMFQLSFSNLLLVFVCHSAGLYSQMTIAMTKQ